MGVMCVRPVCCTKIQFCLWSAPCVCVCAFPPPCIICTGCCSASRELLCCITCFGRCTPVLSFFPWALPSLCVDGCREAVGVLVGEVLCLSGRCEIRRRSCAKYRVGLNPIYTPYMTVCMVITLPKISCICTVYTYECMVLANPS